MSCLLSFPLGTYILKVFPSFSHVNETLFLVKKIKIKKITQEAENNNNGRAPHSSWRNYDDFNEYFWLVAKFCMFVCHEQFILMKFWNAAHFFYQVASML